MLLQDLNNCNGGRPLLAGLMQVILKIWGFEKWIPWLWKRYAMESGTVNILIVYFYFLRSSFPEILKNF